MRSSRGLVLVLILALILPGPVLSQIWLESYENAKRLYEGNDAQAAYPIALTALARYQQESGATTSSYAAILRLLSEICYDLSRYAEGLEYVNKELVILNGQDETTASALSNAALFYQELGQHQEAIQALEKAKEILAAFYRPDEDPIVACYLAQAINFYLANETHKAFELFSRHIPDEPDEEQLQAHFYYSRLLSELGQTESATASFMRTRKKFEELGLGQTIEYASLLSALGQLYHYKGACREAEETFSRAEKIMEENQQTATDEYATLVNQRIVNFYALGDEAQADQLLRNVASQPNGKYAYAVALTNSASWHAMNNALPLGRQQAAEAVATLRAEPADPDRSALYNALKVLAYIESSDRQPAGKEHSLEALTMAESLFPPNTLPRLVAQNAHTRNLLNVAPGREALISAQVATRLLRQHFGKPLGEGVAALTLLGRACQQQGNFSLADSAYSVALQWYETKALAVDQHYAFLLTNFAYSQQEQGNWARARDVLIMVSRLAWQRRDRQFEDYATTLENLALLEMRLGRTAAAKQYLDSALLVFDTDSKKQNTTFGSFQLTLGKYHQAVADFPKAESFLRGGQATLLATAGKDSEPYAQAQNALALLYQGLGNYAEAEPRFREAITIYEKTGNAREVSTARQNLATLYQVQERFPEAELLLTEALRSDEQILGKQHPQYAVTLQNLATLYQKKKDYQKAGELFEHVRQITVRSLGSNHPLYATLTTNLAVLYQDQGQYDQAGKYWLESVAVRKQLLGEDHPDFARSLFGLANYYFAIGKFDEAYRQFEPVIRNYQNQIARYFAVMSEKEKSALYARIKPVFDTYQDFCMQYLKNNGPAALLTEQLYNLQLTNKAILLNASNKLRAAVANTADEQTKALFKEWISTKEQLVKMYSLTKQARSESGVDIQKTEERANDLEKMLSAKSSAFSSLTSPPTADWRQVRANLQPDEAAVEIMRIRKKFIADSVYYVGLVVSPVFAEPRLIIWPYGIKMEQKYYRFFRNSIRHHLQDTISYATFWAPLEAAVPNIKKLWISSDGVFNKINPNTIYDPRVKKWILDEHMIYLVNNTRELAEKKNRPLIPSTANSAALFGFADFNLTTENLIARGGKRTSGTRYGLESEEIPMLPGTEKEVVSIAAILNRNNWQTSSFMLEKANEQTLKKTENPTVLHVATHGFFLPDVDLTGEDDDDNQAYLKNPLFRSGILLAGAGVRLPNSEEDGVLTAFEALNLNLDRTELVTLSACETALGEVRNGEGVYGLQRSFLVAGAHAVLMSLWQVDDHATQELMDLFYQYWFIGKSKAEAFREAQIKLKEKYQYSYYWGAFVMIGD